MRYWLFILIIFLLLQNYCKAQSQYCNKLSEIEKALFNFDYINQSDDVRLNRIETSVYGKSSLILTRPVPSRINRLSKDLSADVIGQEIKPKKDSFLNDNEIITDKKAEDMDFSLVNNLEKKVFKYEFKKIDIGHRLSALEGQVFKKDYSSDDLSTRINRLKSAVMYNEFPAEEIGLVQKAPSCKKENLQEMKKDFDLNNKLVSLEKSLFTKSFTDEKNTIRLARLEKNILHSTFDDDEQTRIDRIESAYKAKDSMMKYKANKSSKRISTAIELGTLILIFLPLLL